MESNLKYNLNSIGWQEFEILAFKCLQYDISPSVQFMDGGSDKGRDIIYSGVTSFFEISEAEKKYVFQVKSKVSKNGFQSLKQDLKLELTKVYITNKFEFENYVLVTNLTLTANEYDELNNVFEIFVKDNNLRSLYKFKIYSYRHFETCIDKNDSLKWMFPTIIRHVDFKLIISELIKGNEGERMGAWVSVFEYNKNRFVYTEVYSDAMNKLKQENIILLSGPPKAGKTFNAEMLILNQYCSESFMPYKIDKIADFDLAYDKEKKQIFLFDDILGKHNIDLYRGDELERKLEYIFELIDENHRCIFTSREYVFRAFLDYSDSDIENLISKISVEVSALSRAEKETILRKYYYEKFSNDLFIPPSELNGIVEHKNFSPETIRAFFDNCELFDYSNFKKHLDLPDEYLGKVFGNLSDEKKVVLLSVLFSLNGQQNSIAYCFKILSEDLNKSFLIDLKRELLLLNESIIKRTENKYDFYHPSMFDFFIRYLGNDIAIYRSILFRNINIDILSLSKFLIDKKNNRDIQINESDILNLIDGFERLINNPSITLFEINSIFSWIKSQDVQLNFQLKYNLKFKDCRSKINITLSKVGLDRFADEDVFHLSSFLDNISFNKKVFTISSQLFSSIINNKKNDPLFWLLVFKITPFVEESVVFKDIPKEWFNNFYLQLKGEIDSLGIELFGDAYPNFPELKLYNDLMNQKKHNEALAMKKKHRVDFMLKTNNLWYSKYKKVKEKMLIIKASQPLGYIIYQKLSANFEHIKSLEEHQKNRYIFNTKKSWWDKV